MENFDIDAILADIRSDVARRRAAGEYPPGLERELEIEFERILELARRGELSRRDELTDLIRNVEKNLRDLSGLTPADSRIPGGSIFHRIVRRVIARHTMGLAGQVRAVLEPMSRIAEIVGDESAGREDADKRMVAAMSKHVLDRVAVVDHLAMVVGELETRIRQIEGGS